MEPWMWGLLLKLPIAIAFVAAYYLIVIKGLRWLYDRLPKSRFVDFLFKERGDCPPAYGPTYRGDSKGIGVLFPDDRNGSAAERSADLRKLPDR